MKIAWLEQSGLLQDRKELQDELQRINVGYYRLNWQHGRRDNFANVQTESAGKISWSKGREALYEAAKTGNYDYYIFVDDDLVFDRTMNEFIGKVNKALDEFKPCILTVRCNDSWQEKLLKGITKSIVPVFIVDLQFQCLSHKAAEFAFPAKFDGGWGTLWYPMLQCNKTPGSVLSIRDMVIKNSAHSAVGEYGGVENKNVESIWMRSRPYMSRHARALSQLIGHRKTIVYLNFFYTLLFKPKMQS